MTWSAQTMSSKGNLHGEEGLTEASHGQRANAHRRASHSGQAPDLRGLRKLKLGPAYPEGSDLRKLGRAQGQGLQEVPGRIWGYQDLILTWGSGFRSSEEPRMQPGLGQIRSHRTLEPIHRQQGLSSLFLSLLDIFVSLQLCQSLGLEQRGTFRKLVTVGVIWVKLQV